MFKHLFLKVHVFSFTYLRLYICKISHEQQQFSLRFSRERLQQYTPVWYSVNWGFSNSASVVLLFFSLFSSFHATRFLSNEGQQPSVAPGCTRGIEPFGAHMVQFRNPVNAMKMHLSLKSIRSSNLRFKKFYFIDFCIFITKF